jgi:hypothetical protein
MRSAPRKLLRIERRVSAMTWRVVVILALLSGLPRSVASQEILAILGGVTQSTSDAGALVRLDPVSGLATPLGFPAPGRRIPGLAVLPNGRTLVVARGSGVLRLLEIDPLTGSARSDLGIVSGLPSTSFLQDLAANPLTGELFGVFVPAPSNPTSALSLFRIHPDTAEASLVLFESPAPRLESIAFSDDGRLWGIGRDRPELYRIDLEQLTLVQAVVLDPPIGGIGLGNGGNGSLLLAECCSGFGTTGQFANEIYRIDPTSGTATLIGSAGAGRRIHDIALAVAGPEVEVPTLSPKLQVLFGCLLALCGWFISRLSGS